MNEQINQTLLFIIASILAQGEIRTLRLNTEEAAKYIGRSKRVLEEEVKKGSIPEHHFGGKFYLDYELDKFLENQ
jgi:excisionase family DNA binding protein